MAAEFDLEPHRKMWKSFCRLMTFSVIGCVVVVIWVIAVIAD